MLGPTRFGVGRMGPVPIDPLVDGPEKHADVSRVLTEIDASDPGCASHAHAGLAVGGLDPHRDIVHEPEAVRPVGGPQRARVRRAFQAPPRHRPDGGANLAAQPRWTHRVVSRLELRVRRRGPGLHLVHPRPAQERARGPRHDDGRHADGDAHSSPSHTPAPTWPGSLRRGRAASVAARRSQYPIGPASGGRARARFAMHVDVFTRRRLEPALSRAPPARPRRPPGPGRAARRRTRGDTRGRTGRSFRSRPRGRGP